MEAPKGVFGSRIDRKKSLRGDKMKREVRIFEKKFEKEKGGEGKVGS